MGIEIPPMMSVEEFEREVSRELAGSPRFQIERFASIKPSASSYLVKGLFSGTGLAVIWGAPKCGKSFWVFDLLMHVSLGWRYRGHRVRLGTIVYCALEGAEGFRNRIEAFRRARLSPASDSDPPFYLMATPLSLVQDHRAFIAEIERQLCGQKPAAVCIDTLNRRLNGSESSDEDMGAYVRAADAVGAAFGCIVPIVHHCGHEGSRPRGHSLLLGAADIQISVKRNSTDNIVAEIELAKDGPVGLQIVSCLKVVTIGVDEDGDPITSCVVDEVEREASALKSKSTPKLNRSAKSAMRALEKGLVERGELPPASSQIPVDVKTISFDTWRDYAYRMGISTSDEPRAKQKAFKDGSDALIITEVVTVCEQHVWLTEPR